MGGVGWNFDQESGRRGSSKRRPRDLRKGQSYFPHEEPAGLSGVSRRFQRADGCWEGEVVWNPMLLSQYVIVHRMAGSPPFGEAERARMIRHFEVTRTPEGGWGMHPESGPYVFFTTLSYVCTR